MPFLPGFPRARVALAVALALLALAALPTVAGAANRTTVHVELRNTNDSAWFTFPGPGPSWSGANPSIVLPPGDYAFVVVNAGTVANDLYLAGQVKQGTPTLQPGATAHLNVTIPADEAYPFDYWSQAYRAAGAMGIVYQYARDVPSTSTPGFTTVGVLASLGVALAVAGWRRRS